MMAHVDHKPSIYPPPPPPPPPNRYPPPPPPPSVPHGYRSADAHIAAPPPPPPPAYARAYVPYADDNKFPIPEYPSHVPYTPGPAAPNPSDFFSTSDSSGPFESLNHRQNSYPIPQHPWHDRYEFDDGSSEVLSVAASVDSAISGLGPVDPRKTANRQGPFVLRNGHTGQSSAGSSSGRSGDGSRGSRGSRGSGAGHASRKSALLKSGTMGKAEQLLEKVTGPLNIDTKDKNSINKLMILVQTPRAVLALLACIQHAIRLLQMRHPGVNLPFGPKGSGRHLDLSKTVTTISDFRNVTSIGKILEVYTSGMSRQKARDGDRTTRVIDLLQFVSGFASLSLKGLGWMGRKEIYKLSADAERHKVLTGYIDRTGAKIWLSLILLNFWKMAREEIPEWRAKRVQKKRLAGMAKTPGARIDKEREDAVTAERNTPQAIKARKKRRRAALVNLAYMPVAVGYGFSKSPVTWKNISQFTILAQGLKTRNFFMDALRAARALKKG